MIEKKIRVTSKKGIDARAATVFVHAANKFKSTPWFEKDEAKINAKSIMGIMSLALAEGDEFILKVEGMDEESASEELEKVIGSSFEE